MCVRLIKGWNNRVTPCELIRVSQTAAFALNESNKVEATAKMNIVLPVDRRLRAFVEANIARNWKYASGPEAPPVSGYKDLVSDFFTDFEEGQVDSKKEFLKSGEMPFVLGGICLFRVRLHGRVTSFSASVLL